MQSKTLRDPKTYLKIALGVCVSAFLIYLASRELDLNYLQERIGSIPIYPLLLCFVGQVCLQILHALRWGTLVQRLEAVPWRKIYSINVLSNAGLYLLPVRLGEFIRPTYSATQTQLNLGQTSSTSVIERTIDGTILGSLALVGLLTSRSASGNQDIVRSASLFLLIFALLLFILLIAARSRKLLLSIISKTIGRISSRLSDLLRQFISQFTQATSELFSVRTIAMYLGLSLSIWLIDTLSLYALFDILNTEFPFQATFMALSLIVLGSLLPSGPGQFGVFEYSVSLGLAVFGMRTEDGILIGALYHSILLGAIILMAISGFLLNRRPILDRS